MSTVGREVSLAELNALSNSGADVAIQHKTVLMPEMVEQLKALTESTENTEVLEAAVISITDAINKITLQAEPVNMRPVAEAISLLRDTIVVLRQAIESLEQPKPHNGACRVIVNRDNRHLIETFDVIPLNVD